MLVLLRIDRQISKCKLKVTFKIMNFTFYLHIKRSRGRKTERYYLIITISMPTILPVFTSMLSLTVLEDRENNFQALIKP